MFIVQKNPKTRTREIVKKFAVHMKRKKFPFQKVFLFGSYAKKQANDSSDIDVAVISNKFKKNWNKNETLLWRLSLDVDKRIEPVGFTPEDFDNEIDPLVHEIKTHGIEVANSSDI